MARLPLKKRKAVQKQIQEKRAADAEQRRKEREERLANRPLTGRQKLSQQRTKRREAQKALRDQKNNQKSNKSSNKSKLKMSSIERENRARFGDKEVDRLKAQHKAWKEARRNKKK